MVFLDRNVLYEEGNKAINDLIKAGSAPLALMSKGEACITSNSNMYIGKFVYTLMF